MGRSRNNKPKADTQTKQKKAIEQPGRDGNNPLGNNAQVNVGNQDMIDLLEDQEEQDPLNTAMILEDDEANALNEKLDADLEKKNDDEQASVNEPEKQEIPNEENIEKEAMDEEKVEDRKSDVANLGDVVNKSAEHLEGRVSEFKKDGLEVEAENANQAVNEIRQINQSMQQVKALNFTAVPRAKQKPNGWKKFWTKATTFFGGVTKAIVNIVTAPVAVYKFFSSKNRMYDAALRAQKVKDYDSIPGWEGAKFSRKRNETADDLLGDARRVPTVWSYLTAGEADKEENGEKVLLNPEVSVMIHQPEAGSAEHMVDKEMGHSMIGISYSRYSNITKKNERYALQYGFYPAGGMRYSIAAMALRGAIFPGELKDDRDHAYSVSRRYPATMEQVGRILKASEKYAAGGYGYYKRNCTTFVRDMAVNVGQVAPAGDSVFKEAEVDYDSKSAFQKYGGHGIETYMNAGARNDLARFTNEEDMTYQNAGNKRVNMVEIARFDESASQGLSDRKALIPSLVGEALRSNSGGNNGKIGSYEFKGSLLANTASEADINDVIGEVSYYASLLGDSIRNTVKKENIDAGPEDVKSFVEALGEGGPVRDALNGLFEKHATVTQAKNMPITSKLYEAVSGQDIKNARIKVKAALDEAGTVYDKYFGNDSRLHTPFMQMVSLYHIALAFLDSQYEKASSTRKADKDEDLEDASVLLNSEMKALYSGEKTYFMITPSRFEGFIQASGGNPDKALKDYYRLAELNNKKDALKKEKKSLSKEEKKELSRLERENNLALEYEKSHRYMLEKNDFNEQDIAYALKLREKEENAEKVEGDITGNNSAGSIYQNMILQKIFGGLKKTFFEDFESANYADDFSKVSAGEDPDGAIRKKWLNDYIRKCIAANTEKFQLLMQTIYKLKGSKNEVVKEFAGMFYKYYLVMGARIDTSTQAGIILSDYADLIWELIMDDMNEYLAGFIRQ